MGTIEVDYKQHLTDDRNRSFIELVESKFKVKVLEIQNLEGVPDSRIWACWPKGEEMNITYYKGNLAIHFFTHEILHSYLICQGFTDSKFLNNNYDVNNPVIQYIFQNHALVTRINNLFAHEKMLPVFKASGFHESLFTSDYSDVPDFQKEFIEEEFHEKHYTNQSITQYIYSFFHAKDVRNPLYLANVTEHFSYLKAKDSELYKILDSTWSSWCATDNLADNLSILETMVNKVILWHQSHRNK